MRNNRPTFCRPVAPVGFLAGLTAVIAVASFMLFSVEGLAEEASGPRVAGSVCEAHELRALHAADPHLEIEIPKQFDHALPSQSACESHAAALDETTPGLVQPIPFSHKHHAGDLEIDCQYCHSGTDRSPAAGVPSVEVCMGCHAQFSGTYDEMSGIQTLKEHWENQEPIEWLQIHRLPEHTQFRHNRHIQAGVDCAACHGNVEDHDKVFMLEDTKYWPWGLPTHTLEMGWCVQCHRENKVSQDCHLCHY